MLATQSERGGTSMKIESKRRWAALMVAIAALAIAVPAYAGYKVSYATVAVLNADGSGRGSGSISSARSSSNSVEWIYCEVSGSTTGGGVTCSARTASNVRVDCDSEEPSIVAAAGAINTHSYVRFFFNTEGDCTSLYVKNGSQNGF
jgi:hypothetical protein